MKRIIFTLLLLLIVSLASVSTFAQCTPETPEQCPDPENNGQVCPDSLAIAFVGRLYNQVATIKPPLNYYLPPDSSEITLHHVKLMQIGNLPSGLIWQSNTTDSNFTAGDYYCVLMEGIPETEGEYHLRIVVDVYVLLFNIPVKVATVTDSTSLTLVVVNDSGIEGDDKPYLIARHNIPNPFRINTRIDFYSKIEGTVDFEVYSILGKKVYNQQIAAIRGENSMVFNGLTLPEGPYYYVFRSAGNRSTGIMIRKD